MPGLFDPEYVQAWADRDPKAVRDFIAQMDEKLADNARWKRDRAMLRRALRNVQCSGALPSGCEAA
jgi:hypothetical protein